MIRNQASLIFSYFIEPHIFWRVSVKRKILVASLAVILAAIAGLLAYQMIAPRYSNTVASGFFTKGREAPYAPGSSVSDKIVLQRTSVLTGSFTTSNTVSFYILTSEEYSTQFPSFSNSISYYYTTGEVPSANINVTLPAATYYLLFVFNSTGYGATTLSITQSFVATSA